jgi:hypothetical protein
VKSFFITDDNFARNKNCESIFDRIIELKRRDRLKINVIMQVDTMCHKIPNFVEKAARAGCKKVFIGLESINPQSLKSASKGQNRITEYRKMLQAWKRAQVLTYAGYILGFPSDTPQSIERDIKIIQREAPDRYHGVLHADAAAGLEGSPTDVPARRADGDRYQSLRRRARDHGSSAHDFGRMAGHLPSRLATLLHACAYRDAD